MTLPKLGLSGPALNFANAVQRWCDGLASVRMQTFNTVVDLPSAALWDGRQVIVRNINGAGTPGLAFALDGAWHDMMGATIA